MNLKFWKKETEPSIMAFIETIKYCGTEEFQKKYNESSPEEQSLIRKKIQILFDCVEEYKDALEYEIASRELQEQKEKWSKP